MFRFSCRLFLPLAAAVLLLAEAGHASAQVFVGPPPGVSYYAPPVVSYYAPPVASYYTAPRVSYYAPPAVSYYAPPAVSYYAPPAVSYYPAPPTTVTTYRYGLLGRRQVRVATYYP